MKNTIKKIIKEYHKELSEQGGYDDEDIMKDHYSGLMTEMGTSALIIFKEYKKLVNNVLPEILDEKVSDELVKNIEKLKEFLESYDNFLEKNHKRNLKRFKEKGD